MVKRFSAAPGFKPVLVTEAPVTSTARRRTASGTTSRRALVRSAAPAPDQSLPEKTPKGLIAAPSFQITGGSIDYITATTRFLVWRGHKIESARSIADVAIALAGVGKSRGRKPLGPRLFCRGNVIYMTDGWHKRTTDCSVAEGEDFRQHVGANAKLAEMVEKRVRKILGLVLKSDVTVEEMFAAWIVHHLPGDRPEALDVERHARIVNELSHLESFMGKSTLHDIGLSTGMQYVEHATAQAIKSQKSAQDDPKEIRFVARSTARAHVVTFIMVLRWYCELNGIDYIPIQLPRIIRTAVEYLPFEHIVRLISACRGRVYDADGRVIGHHDKRARYECVVRFIMLYFYGGTRHNNILLLTHGWDPFYGHINAKLGTIERQGPQAVITNKRRETSALLGSLADLVLLWEAQDAEMRLKHPGRYVHIIHDEAGKPIADIKEKDPLKAGKRMGHLFREVRELAGLPKARPHQLKHSGVTYAALAGMHVADIEHAFSTSYITLYTYYRSLRPWFDKGHTKPFAPERFKWRALRHLLPPTRRKLLAKAA